MAQKYYAEEIQKNTRYRTEYQDTIFEFLKGEKDKATKIRNAFFFRLKNREDGYFLWLGVDMQKKM